MIAKRQSQLISPAILIFVILMLLIPLGSGQCETVQTGVIMAGTRYATTYYIKKGEAPGPTVVVIGGVHGDEIAGYRAAEELVNWNITAGTLWVLPDAHKEAIRRNVRGYPGNMNNMFPGKRDGSDMERLAYQIFEMIRSAHPNLLLTLHESRDFHAVDPKRYGQTFCYDFDAINATMQPALNDVNLNIARNRDKFSLFVEPHPTCPTYQAWVKLKTPATSIETCRNLPLALRIKYQLAAVSAFLDEMHMGYQPLQAPLLAPLEEPPFRTQHSATPRPEIERDPDTFHAHPTSTNGVGLNYSPGKKLSWRRSFTRRPVVKVADSFEVRVASEHTPRHQQFAWTNSLVFALVGVIFGCAIGSFTFHRLTMKK